MSTQHTSLDNSTSEESTLQYVNFLREALQRKELDVLFLKRDGTERLMHCTLDALKIPQVDVAVATVTFSERLPQSKKRAQSPDTMVVWDLQAYAWRSFRIDSIISWTEHQV